jgi:membrane protein DedA with SNARE-associated domain
VVPLWGAVLAVAAGMLVGDSLIYAAAGPVMSRARARWTRRPRVARIATALATRPLWRDAGLAGLRFVPGARTPMAFLARELRTSRSHFLLVVGAGSLAWAGVWTGGGSALVNGLASSWMR